MLQVEIYTPEKTVFKGEAKAVRLPGESGLFEVFTGHAPLISSLNEGTVRLTDSQDNQTNYSVQSGFVEVLNNQISILVEAVD